MTGLTLMLAALVGGGSEVAPETAQAFLRQHPELTLARSSYATCPAGDAVEDALGAVIQKDLSGDDRPDTAFVVVSRAAPARFGVVVVHGDGLSATAEQWVVPLRADAIRGLTVFRSPYGTWLLVHGCTRQQGGAYAWDGTRYTSAPVM